MKKRNKNGYTKAIKRALENYRWWDHSYMVDFEKAIWKNWLDVYSHPTKYRVMGDAPRRLVIAKLAVKLLSLMEESIIEKVDPNDDLRWGESEGEGRFKTSKLLHIPEYKVINGKYVNVKNARRFWNPRQMDFHVDNKGMNAFSIQDLYEAKLWHLYSILREYYLKEMWD